MPSRDVKKSITPSSAKRVGEVASSSNPRSAPSGPTPVAPWISGRRVDLHTHELVAQRLAKSGEALAGDFLSPLKRRPITHRSSCVRRCHHRQVRVGETERASMLRVRREGKRRLTHDRRDDRRFHAHGHGEATGETHAHRADTWPPCASRSWAASSPKVVHNRAGLVRGEQ